MADVDLDPRPPGWKPWAAGIVLLALLAAAALWLLDRRAELPPPAAEAPAGVS